MKGGVEKFHARREAGKQLIEQLQTAVQGNDSAAADQLLQKFRQGFRQHAEGREQFLDEIDKILQPEQRARIVLHLVQRAHETKKSLVQLVDHLLMHGGDDI